MTGTIEPIRELREAAARVAQSRSPMDAGRLSALICENWPAIGSYDEFVRTKTERLSGGHLTNACNGWIEAAAVDRGFAPGLSDEAVALAQRIVEIIDGGAR